MAMAKAKTKTKAMTPAEKEAHYNEGIKNLMPWVGDTLPNMSNYTPERLVDEVGILKELEKDAKKVIATLNGIIDSKNPENEVIKGENYKLTIIPVTQMRLDAELAKSKIRELAKLCGKEPDLEVEACILPIDMSQHRYSAVD